MGKKWLTYSSAALIFTLLLAACSPVGDTQEPGPETATQALETTSAPADTVAPETTEAPGPTGVQETLDQPETTAPETAPATTDTPIPQDTPASTETPEPQAVDIPVFASSLLDTALTAGGEEVGRVSGLIVDLAAGEITYAVVTSDTIASAAVTTAALTAGTAAPGTIEPGVPITVTTAPTATVSGAAGAQGPAESRVPVPWDAMRLARAGGDPEAGLVLVLEVDEMALAFAPELPAGVDELTTAEWDAGISSYWANYIDVLLVTGEETEPMPSLLIPGGQLGGIDFEVESLAGEVLGEVEDFIISPDAKVQYAVIESSTFQAVGDELIPAPWTALHWSANQDTFLFGGSPEFLDEAPAFTPSGFPDISAPGWDEELSAYWEDFTFPETEGTEQRKAKPAALTRVLGGVASGPRGEMLGGVNDLFLGPAGAIEYALVSIKSGLFPVPYGAFDAWVGGVNWLIFGLDFDTLYGAPVYGSLEDMPSPHGPDQAAWQDKVDAYWQDWVDLPSEGAGVDGPPDFPALASTTLGAPVLDESGAAAGEVANLALSLGGAGRIDYVIVNTGLAFIPVPWSMFVWSETDSVLVFAGPAARLAEAPSFDSLSEWDLERLGQDEALREYWAENP